MIGLGQFSDSQSLVPRTLPGSLAVSTELAKRAVSSICLAGLCDVSLVSISFGLDPLSASSTVGFRGILASPWPFSVSNIDLANWLRHLRQILLLDGQESMRRSRFALAKASVHESGTRRIARLISACARRIHDLRADQSLMAHIGGGFNRSLQHILRTSQLGFDRARSFGVFH